jgi:hypothetical protein
MSGLPKLSATKTISEEDIAKLFGGEIVTFEGKRCLSFPPPSELLSFGEIVCVTKSGIVGIISKNLKSQYFVGVPEGHFWFNQKASAFNSLDVPISVYGKVTQTDLDSIEKDGHLMRSIAIEMTMESFSDKRKRYWITWDSDIPPGPGSVNLLRKEVKKICQNTNKV